VQGEVAHPLDVAGAVDGGDHGAQVGGDRRLQRQQRERPLLGRGAQVVDADVGADHLLGQLQVGLQEGAGGLLHRLRDLFAHAGQPVGQPFQLLLVRVPHPTSVLRPPLRQSPR
jgi:hypothetical protein